MSGRKWKQEDSAGTEDVEEDAPKKKQYPNYFVAIQVTNPQVSVCIHLSSVISMSGIFKAGVSVAFCRSRPDWSMSKSTSPPKSKR